MRTDTLFRSWSNASLVWLPEYGMGWYPVREEPYDLAYFHRYQAMANTYMGRELTRIRVEMVQRHMPAGSVLDVGIGCGQFLEAMDGPRHPTMGYDVNPAGRAWLGSRGKFAEPSDRRFDALTFWDSLEHIRDPYRVMRSARRWVFAALPIVPGHGPPPLDWKHLRTDEHCWYWTRSGLLRWMDGHGFDCVEHNTAESLAGREDIGSFAFRRRSP